MTVVIITYNEEVHIRRAVQNVSDWAEDVFVLDSHSEDQTVSIARQEGAEVFFNEFEDYASQRNYALDELPYNTDWMLFLDADELVSDELKGQIRTVLRGPAHYDGYYLHRRFYWMNQWLRWGGMYPVKLLRLVRHERAWCNERQINEHLMVEGETRELEGDLYHIERRSISAWIEKHNHYATLEAEELLASERSDAEDEMARFFGTQAERKRWLRKKVWEPLLPPLIRPFAYFVYVYIIKLGFLDGVKGFAYHVLQGFWFMFLIDCKYIIMKTNDSKEVNSNTQK
ncbi:glycosyltransferase family 2 protein [Salinibacter ruber]|uniref:glycosyltransferase family 2 protein n=1 Tax=Salinibacter ruber TaxID=146919 RepID=UPI00216AAC7A|nr:glycosyltransferase involved in cell wall biosynthesis [Salinibacter ruber]